MTQVEQRSSLNIEKKLFYLQTENQINFYRKRSWISTTIKTWTHAPKIVRMSCQRAYWLCRKILKCRCLYKFLCKFKVSWCEALHTVRKKKLYHCEILNLYESSREHSNEKRTTCECKGSYFAAHVEGEKKYKQMSCHSSTFFYEKVTFFWENLPQKKGMYPVYSRGSLL